jgi:adenylate cyclase
MEKLKKYIFDNFDSLFILLILVSVACVNYFVYAKTQFLQFYYLPVMAAGLYLGRRTAVHGAFLIILMVNGFILLDPESGEKWGNSFDHYLNLTVWGGFLILSGALVGTLSEKFNRELKISSKLAEDLSAEQNQLQSANDKLEEYSNQLENKVVDRTKELETSRTVIETLKEKVENILYSVMDSTVARMMIEGELRNEKRRISVMFSDLQGFTSFSDENPPEMVVDVLNSYLKSMEECITQYHGHIDKYMGDGIMVEFGAPVSFQFHSIMAIHAAVNMQNKIKETHPKWAMRIGIATGSSVIGLFGHQRKSYSCIGDAANLASRLEGICEPGFVYIDDETHNDAKLFFNTEKVVNLGGQRDTDIDGENEIDRLEEEVKNEPDNPDKNFALGKAYINKRDASQALKTFKKVLELNPDHTEAKLAYAEATIKQEEFERIAIKGKSRRVNVYKVIGPVDPLLNREKIPQSFYDKYAHVADKIKISDDVILPIECLDGSLRHGRTVAVLAYALADKLNLSIQEKEDILIAGFLHDIGKNIIPLELIDSPRKLTESEYNLVKKHATEGTKSIRKLGYNSNEIIEMVESHHESFDGSGYPHGLKGEAIPIGGRILNIVDTFDAMTSHRLYGEIWEYKSTIREIQKNAAIGKFDPDIVQAFTELFEI